MNNIHDLFLLMFTLSQMRDKDKIIQLFQDSITELFHPQQFIYSEQKVGEPYHFEEIVAANLSHGYIYSMTEPSKEVKQLMQNAVQMLAVILDKLRFEYELEKRAESLENIDKQRLDEINAYVKDLENAKLASLNLIEDLKGEINERKKTQEELLKSEIRFRTAFENSAVGISLTSTDGKFLQVNSKLCQILGYTKEELLELSYQDITYHEDIKLSSDFVSKSIQQPSTFLQFEKRYVRKNGDILWVEISSSLFKDEDDKPLYFITHIVDITERKVVEQKLRDRENKLSSIIRVAPTGIGLVINRVIQEVNNVLCDMTGYTREELLGENAIILYPSNEDYEYVGKYKYEQIREKGTGTIETRFKRKDKRFIDVLMSSTPLDINDLSVGVTFTALDITERKKAEEEIKTLNAELEERVASRTSQLEKLNKELKTFSYSVSHDLKAPLRGIDGYSKLLLEIYNKELNEEAQTFIKNIRKGTLQMGNIIEDLLSYSRLERAIIKQSNTPLNRFIENLVSVYQKEIEDYGILVHQNIPEIFVTTDIDGFTIAFRNLFENAIKFSKKQASPKITIGFEEHPNNWLIFVEDNGIGFDMKYGNKIFEIFQRLHRIEDFPGTGIGLAMVAKAMDRIGGRVWAESQEGKGAKFYLELIK